MTLIYEVAVKDLMMNMKSTFLLAGILLVVSSLALIQYAFALSATCCAPGQKIQPSDPIHGASQIAPGKLIPVDPIHGASQISPGFVKNLPSCPQPGVDLPPC